MKTNKFFKDLLFFGSVYYTLITSVLIMIATLVQNGSATLIDTKRFLLILLFSFIMGLGSAILRANVINRTAASAVHAVCYILGFLLFVALSSANFAMSVIFTLVFAIIYVAVTLIARCLLKIGVTNEKKPNAPAAKIQKNKNKKEKSSYTNQFLK
ncbi:MAG: hypothetical protein E7592_03255 [Ruminococcaceae bacterium]|nr:hypothetical protein [Oscillospiraceae bacterium]